VHHGVDKIGQLPEQTLRNTNHIADDKSSDYSRAGTGKTSIMHPPTFGLISPNPGQPSIAKALKIGRASVYRALAE
jgi:hypothetical protein